MSFEDDTSDTPSGWYTDPADPTRLRRWDGTQWTQDVVPDPDHATAAPAGPEFTPSQASEPAPPVPTPPAPEPPAQEPPAPEPPAPEPSPEPAPVAAPIYIPAPTAAPIYIPAPTSAASPQSAPPVSPIPTGQPPLGQPVPPSPLPTSSPPLSTSPTTPGPPSPTAPSEPTVPRPSPPVNQHPNPPSGPVSLPEWANLPGLTLPPDLTAILGADHDSVLRTPTFAETEQRELPTLPGFEPPYIPQRPDVQHVGAHSSEAPTDPGPPTEPPAPPSAPTPPAPPATPYAPPPVGAQYDVPPPPGMAHVPGSGHALPPSAFVAPQPVTPGMAALPPVGSVPPAAVVPDAVEQAPVFRDVPALPAAQSADSSATVAMWLIAVLPLLQFAVIYLLFKPLGFELAPGMQWGILAVPAAFSLLFANADRRRLTDRGLPSPNLAFALLPPLYLAMRCVITGRSAVLPLVAWIVLQVAAAAGVYFLLPTVLAAGIHSIG